jgi:hypothetical protein
MVNKDYLTFVHDRVVINGSLDDLNFNNIIYLDVGAPNLINIIKDHILYSEHQRVLIFPNICYGVLNNELFKQLNNE